MIGLDTSVVVRLLIGVPQPQASVAYALVDSAESPVAVSDLVVGESYFALRYHYAVPHRKAVSAILTLLMDARVAATGVAVEVLREAGDGESPGLMDRLIHADYGHDGAALHTFDRRAARQTGATLLSA